MSANVVGPSPWYRHRWPWMLMAGPAAVIVAGGITLWLAVRSNDGLVADDYYKQGMTINRTLARAKQAQAMGLEAWLAVRDGRAELRLVSRTGATLPPRVRLTLFHPTRSGLDQALLLTGQDGVYGALVAELPAGRWQFVAEDEGGTWRLTGAAVPSEAEIKLEPQQAAAK